MGKGLFLSKALRALFSASLSVAVLSVQAPVLAQIQARSSLQGQERGQEAAPKKAFFEGTAVTFAAAEYVQLLSLGSRGAQPFSQKLESEQVTGLSDDEKRFVVCAAASSLKGRWAQEQWAHARRMSPDSPSSLEPPTPKSALPALDSDAGVGSAPYWREKSTDAARTFWVYQNVLAKALGPARLQEELQAQRKHLQGRLQRQELSYAQLAQVSIACQRLSLSWIGRGLVSAQDAQHARTFAWQAWDQGLQNPVAATGLPKDAPASGVVASQGSAFVVAPGYLLTNAHVVRGASRIWLQNGQERVLAELVETAPSADLALLRADVRSPALKLQLTQEPRLGEPVAALGYPLADTLGSTQKAAFGRVSADSLELPLVQLDLQVQPGFSGAPVLDERGQVVGVVTGTLDQRKSLASRGVTASNVAFSARLSASGSWLEPWLALDNSRETPRAALSSRGVAAAGSFQQVLQQARASVYLVEALP